MGFMFDEGFMGGLGQPAASPGSQAMIGNVNAMAYPLLGGVNPMVDELVRRAQAEGVPTAPAQSDVGSVVGGGLFGTPTVVLPAPEGAAPDRPGMLSAAGISNNPLAAAAMTGARNRLPGGESQAGPTGPIRMDPAELSFADQPIAGQQAPGGRGALGMSMNLPTGVSTRGLSEGIDRLKGIGAKYGSVVDDALNETGKAYGKAKRAEENLALAKANQNEAVAGAIEQGMRAADDYVKRNKEIIKQAEQRVDDKLGAWEKARQEYQAAEVDPSRRFSGGSKVGAAIAMALGAYGAALTGGQNTAMQIVQSEIDRDIAAQKANIGKKRDAVGMAGNEFQTALNLLGDEQAAEAAAKIALLDKAKQKVQIETLRYGTPIAQANAAKSIAELDRAQALETAKMQTAALDSEKKTIDSELTAEARKLGVQQGNQKLKQSAQAIRASAAKAVNQAPPSLYIRDPNTYMPDGKDKQAAQKIMSPYNKSRPVLNELIRWRAKHGAKLEPAEAKRGDVLLLRFKNALRDFDGTGANLTPVEEKLMGLDFEGSDFGFIMEALETVAKTMDMQVDGALKDYGYGVKAQRAKAKGTKR